MATLRLENIYKEFKRVPVLEDINLETGDNEFIVVLGSSGCGKSTLLRIIAGLEQPTNGKVFVDNKDITSLDPRERNIAMIFQNFPIYPHLTVYENLSLPLKFAKKTKDEIKKKVYLIAEQLEITSVLNRNSSQLSGGEMQRIAIGKNLLKNSNIFLFDEPLNSLDANIKLVIKNLIKEIHKKEEKLFIYVTHDYREAMSLADKIIVLNEKKVVQYDIPEITYRRPINLFVANLIGEPKMNILTGEIINIESKIYFKTILGNIYLNNGFLKKEKSEIIAGIRPENIFIHRTRREDSSLKVTIKDIEYNGSSLCIGILEIKDFKILVSANNENEVSEEGNTRNSNEDLKKGDVLFIEMQVKNMIFF